MKKQLAAATILSVSMLALPAVALARHGSDDSSGHGNRENKISSSSSSAGTVLSQTSTVPSTNDTTPAPTEQTAMTIKDAIAAAEKQFPGKTIVRAQKESEHGSNVWRIRFSDGSRIDVDASTGDITTAKDHDGNDDSGRDSSEDD